MHHQSVNSSDDVIFDVPFRSPEVLTMALSRTLLMVASAGAFGVDMYYSLINMLGIMLLRECGYSAVQ